MDIGALRAIGDLLVVAEDDLEGADTRS